IVSQKPEDFSKSLCFFFHTKFFPEDVEQELIQATTRRLFYLSVKSTILNRRDLCPSLDVAILLASLASQAEYGDFCENELSDIEELTYLPRRIFRLIPTQLWTQIQSTQGVTQKFREQYRSHKGMNRDKAELQYLKVAQMHNLFGVDFFPIVNKCHANAWLGVTAAGLQLYGKCQRDPPQFTFPWNLIKNVSYRERKFTIKLTSSFRGTSKSSQVAPIITSMPAGLNDIRGQTVISSKESQPNRSPLIGVTDQGFIGLTVGSSVGGSSTSAASLLSTPISARLVPSNPPVSPNMIDSSVNYPSRGVSKFVSCDPMQQLSIPKSFKGFSKGSRCIPGLSIKSSCYCANEFAIIDNSVDCLRVSRAQAGENNVALLSKTLPNSNSSTLLISVVEVWLADPNQAKTVMSMCTGNHSLFMRRRQPDSIEVQQMRAQAREERARREVERARLAKARAEKAEALEAKSALEARCAQLEEVLNHQQKFQKPYTSIDHNRLNEIHEIDSPHSYASHRTSNECNCKLASNSVKEESQKNVITVAMLTSHSMNDDVGDMKPLHNSVENVDRTTYDAMSPGDHYFDDYCFYLPTKAPNVYFKPHEKSWNDCIHIDHNNLFSMNPVYPNFSIKSFSVSSAYIDQILATGSASVPITPHVRRSQIKLGQYVNFSSQSSLSPAELTTSPVEVILYPSYLINNIGPVYPEGSYYEVAIKSLWSGIRFVTCETPTTPVGQSISRELQTSLTPFIIFPSCSSALHSNGVLYSNSRIRPINSSYCNHNLWFSTAKSTAYHSSAVCHICLQPQSYMSRVPYAAPSSVSKHPRHSVSDCNVQSIQHNSIDPSQYSYPSSSLDAILSSIVTQRSQLQIPSCSQPICFLSRQQLRSEKLKSSEPVITRSRSHVKMFHSENSGLASSLKSSLMSIHSISHPTNRSFSFKCLHCSTNVCPSYSDLHTGRRYPNETRANSLLNCQYDSATTNEYFRCIKSHDVPTANNDPPWSITLHKLSRTDKCNKDESIYLYESNPLNSQRNLLTNQLQEERAHFTFLWTQFSRQLCNTWAYLKTARGQQFDEPYDFLLHTIGNNVCSNPFHDCELPRYASGPSDGAFTDGVNICNMCDPEACDWHSCLHDTILDHHLYETYSQLNHNVSSETSRNCTSSATSLMDFKNYYYPEICLQTTHHYKNKQDFIFTNSVIANFHTNLSSSCLLPPPIHSSPLSSPNMSCVPHTDVQVLINYKE
ncbi:Radixin, partial [Schistosoma japonicum]